MIKRQIKVKSMNLKVRNQIIQFKILKMIEKAVKIKFKNKIQIRTKKFVN
jgi:hypothetical protein